MDQVQLTLWHSRLIEVQADFSISNLHTLTEYIYKETANILHPLLPTALVPMRYQMLVRTEIQAEHTAKLWPDFCLSARPKKNADSQAPF